MTTPTFFYTTQNTTGYTDEELSALNRELGSLMIAVSPEGHKPPTAELIIAVVSAHNVKVLGR